MDTIAITSGQDGKVCVSIKRVDGTLDTEVLRDTLETYPECLSEEELTELLLEALDELDLRR